MIKDASQPSLIHPQHHTWIRSWCKISYKRVWQNLHVFVTCLRMYRSPLTSLFFLRLVSSFFSSRLLVSVSSQVTFNVSPPDPDPEPVHVGKQVRGSGKHWSRPRSGNYNQKVEILRWKPCSVLLCSGPRLSSWSLVGFEFLLLGE